MNAFTAIDAASAPAPADDSARGMALQQLRMLGRLAEAGVNLAVGLEQQVAGQEAGGGGDVGLRYARIARAVRLTLALQSKLMRALDERDAASACAARAAQTEQDGADRDETESDEARAARAHGDRVGRIVRRVIAAEHADEEVAETLDYEVQERLGDPDIYGDILDRPIGELVALICRDLGLSPDWDRLAEEAWAKDEIKAASPGSPFAARAGPGVRPSPF